GPTIGEMIEQTGLPCDSRLSEAHWKGTPMLTRRPASLCGRRLLLLGDAAGYVEPFTGEGIGWAMQSALAAVPIAVQAQSRWEPEMEQAWILQHRRLVRCRQWTCRMLASLLRRPRLIRASTSILSVAPTLATPIMYLLNRLPRQTATAS